MGGACFRRPEQLTCSFSRPQISLLEKLNRADRDHLVELGEIVVPDRWDLHDLAYSPLAVHYAALEDFAKAVVVHKPGQVFGAYERGRLVRWGPVNSGAASSPTPDGLFYLNWKSTGRHSTVNRNWFLRWYFNFHNRRGTRFTTTSCRAGLSATAACGCWKGMPSGSTSGATNGRSASANGRSRTPARRF